MSPHPKSVLVLNGPNPNLIAHLERPRAGTVSPSLKVVAVMNH